MNTCVSDDYVIVNIQGIRYVTWGESNYASSVAPNKRFFVTVTYKGNHQTFNYEKMYEAKDFFDKIRTAMDKTHETKQPQMPVL